MGKTHFFVFKLLNCALQVFFRFQQNMTHCLSGEICSQPPPKSYPYLFFFFCRIKWNSHLWFFRSTMIWACCYYHPSQEALFKKNSYQFIQKKINYEHGLVHLYLYELKFELVVFKCELTCHMYIQHMKWLYSNSNIPVEKKKTSHRYPWIIFTNKAVMSAHFLCKHLDRRSAQSPGSKRIF